MIKSLFAIFVLTVIFCGMAQGEDIDTSKPLSLQRCIQIALERASNIKASDLQLKSAKLDREDARSEYFPSVTIDGQYQFSDRVDLGWDEKNYDSNISAEYTIWDHGRRKTSYEQSKINEKSAQSDYIKTKQELIFELTQAYYNLLQAEKLVEVDEMLIEISKTNLRKVEAFQSEGIAIPADIAAAKVQLGNDELTLIKDQDSFETARGRLASLMGLDPLTYFGIEDDPDYNTYIRLEEKSAQQALLMPEPSLTDSIDKAIKNRPELHQLNYRLTSLELSLRQTQLERYPIISAQANYGLLFDDYLRDRGAYKNYDSWNVLARIQFPIFDGGVSKRRVQKSEIAIEQFKEDISERERSIILEVQQAYLNLNRSKKGLDIAREQVINAYESLRVTQGRYEQNKSIFLEVLSAQARYAQALTNRVRAFYEYKIAERQMQKTIGEKLE